MQLFAFSVHFSYGAEVILCKNFVWVHLPKTGGTWVRETLAKYAPASWGLEVRYPGHHSIRSAGPKYEGVPAFHIIRNPWEWYVSWYGFWGTHLRQRSGCFAKPEGAWNPEERKRADIASMPFPDAVKAIEGAGLGIGYHYRRICLRTDGSSIDFGRFDSMRTELVRLLTKYGCPPPEPLHRAIMHDAPKMTSVHRPWREYYSDRKLVDLVAGYEAELIERFGYEPPTAKS